MNVQHKLCEAMKETEGPKGGTEKTLQYAGRPWFAQSTRCRVEPLMGFQPATQAASSPQQMSRADLAAELSGFFCFVFCFKEKLPALKLLQPSHYPHR